MMDPAKEAEQLEVTGHGGAVESETDGKQTQNAEDQGVEQHQGTEQEQGAEVEQGTEQGQGAQPEQGAEEEQGAEVQQGVLSEQGAEQEQGTEQEQDAKKEKEQGAELENGAEQEKGQDETEHGMPQESARQEDAGPGHEPVQVEEQQVTEQKDKQEENEQSEVNGQTRDDQATEQSEAQEVDQTPQSEQQSGGMDQGPAEVDQAQEDDKTAEQGAEKAPELGISGKQEQEIQQSMEENGKEQLDIDSEKETSKEQTIPKLYTAVKGNNFEEVVRLLEDGEDVNLRAMDGKTLLHLAVSVNAQPAIFTALLDKIDDFTQRDENGDSVLEMIYSTDYSETAETALSEKVRKLIEEGDVEKLRPVVLSGWSLFPNIPEDIKGQSKEMADLLENLSQYQERIETLHKGIESGDSEVLTILQDCSELCEACDRTGLPPLTKAVILRKTDLAMQIASKFPDSLNVKDNLGRLPLHYAAVCPDNGRLYEALQGAGAVDTPDQAGNTPSIYKEKPELLDFQKVQERIQNILNAPVTARVKQQVIESQGHSQVQGYDNEVEKTESPKPNTEGEEKGDNSAKLAEEPPKTPDWLKQPRSGAPTSYEGQYLASTVGVALTRALAEIAERRPWDPIEYLAQYLYKFHADMKYLERQQVLEAELRAEREEEERRRAERAFQREEVARIRAEERRVQQEQAEEEDRQREQEEQEKKARELSLAQPPDLPTVKEETGEVEGSVRERDENGQTELHRLAAQPGKGSELVGLLNLGFSLADRDAQYRTARDIAEGSGLEENVEAMDNYVANLIEGERLSDLQQLILDGYDKLHVVLEQVSTDGLPENVTTFIKEIPELQAKIKDVIKAVRSGVVRDVSQSLTRKMFLSAKDNMGRTALHNAILYRHREVAEYIAETFPFTLTTRDTLNRTPLHYAAGLSDHLYEFITQHGGDATLKDAKGKTPHDYKVDKEEIIKLTEEAPGIEITTPADDDDEDNQSKTENEDEENNSENATEET